MCYFNIETESDVYTQTNFQRPHFQFDTVWLKDNSCATVYISNRHHGDIKIENKSVQMVKYC